MDIFFFKLYFILQYRGINRKKKTNIKKIKKSVDKQKKLAYNKNRPAKKGQKKVH